MYAKEHVKITPEYLEYGHQTLLKVTIIKVR